MAAQSPIGGGGVKPLSDAIWRAFGMRDVFGQIQRGKRLKTADHVSGSMPYISSSAMNNGVDNFIANDDGVRIFSNCLTIANSGSVGSCFYHSYKFVASDHVTQLKKSGLSAFQYLFLSVMCLKLSCKYNFNREISDKRIGREKVFLPATPDGKPDFEYMDAYGHKIERERIDRYFAYRLTQQVTASHQPCVAVTMEGKHRRRRAGVR